MTYTESADTIKRLAFQWQGILELAAFLSEVGSLESTIADWKKQSDEAHAALQAQQDELAHVTQLVQEATMQASAIVLKAHTDADALLASTNDEIARTTQQATDHAAQMLVAERTIREQTLAGVTRSIQSAQGTLASIQAQIQQATDEQKVAADLLASTQAELDTIQARARKLAG